MGKYKSEAEIYAEIDEQERQEEIKLKTVFIEREEKFRERMLDKKLDSIDNLSKSIMQLAVSMAASGQKGPVINIYAGSASTDEMKQIISSILEPVTTK